MEKMAKFFGLDLGSHSLKAVELEKINDKGYRLKAAGIHVTPPNATLSESDLDQDALASAIKELLRESRISSRQVVTAFPESQIFTRVIEMPQMSDRDLRNAMKWEAEQYIPLSISDVKVDWTVLERDIPVQPDAKDQGKKNMSIFLVAAPINLIERYLKVLRITGLEPVAFETETVAIVRSLASAATEAPTTLLISIGASTTDLCVVDHGVIQLTRSIGTGGIALTKAVAQKLGFEIEQAEEYKKSYGLSEDQLEGKILQAIKPVFDVVVSEIEKAIIHFQSRQPTKVIKRAVLIGGTSQLPGVVVYLVENLGLEIQIGNPWEDIQVPQEFKKFVGEIENQVGFAVALGLAKKPL